MSERTFLPIRNDVIFRLYFADERNQEFLIGFLKSVLRIPEDEYDTIEIVDPHLIREYPTDKMGIVDVKLRTKLGNTIHIEIQLQLFSAMKKRVYLYDAKLIAEQMGIGDDYEQIKRVISIIITDDELIQDSARYHHRFTLYDADARVEFSDLLEVDTLELGKLPKDNDGTTLYTWAKFIAADTEEELITVAESNPQLERAAVSLRELSADEHARSLYERREKALRDERARLSDARREGEQKRNLELARILLSDLGVERIAEVTGLSIKEIEALIKEERQ